MQWMIEHPYIVGYFGMNLICLVCVVCSKKDLSPIIYPVMTLLGVVFVVVTFAMGLYVVGKEILNERLPKS